MPRTRPFTKAECEAWAADPATNPRSGRAIKANGPMWRALREAALDHGVKPPVHTLPQCLEDLEFAMRELELARARGGARRRVHRRPRA